MKHPTTAEPESEREVVVTRTINGPARLVFEAFTRAELFRQWWVPKSFGLTLLACELDVRVGGKYRLVFSHEGAEMAFFGTYLEVVPNSRIVWTNDEGGEGGAVTTATFEERNGKTLLAMRDLYPSKAALDAARDSGSTGALGETLDQLDEMVVRMAAGTAGA